LCGMDTRVCDDCEPEGGDAASVTSEVGCRRRSRLTGAAQHSHKRRSVTFDLPPQVERACCAAASDPSPDRDVEDEEMVPPWELPGGLVCARESIFVIPGVDCLGCLLGHRTLKPVVDALRRNAAHLPEVAWPAAGLAAYEGLRAKCRAEGLLAPEWSEEGIRLHFWQHALDPVLEAARLARSLDLARRLLMGEVQACIGGGDGTVPPQKLCLLDRLGAAEAKQHAWIQKLLAACESEQAREGPQPSGPAGAPWTKRRAGPKCVQRRAPAASAGAPAAGAAAPAGHMYMLAASAPPARPSPAPAPFAAPQASVLGPPSAPAAPAASTAPTTPTAPSASAPPSAPAHPCFLHEQCGETSGGGHARPAAQISARGGAAAMASPGPRLTLMDADIAKTVLRDFLSSHLRPCVRPPGPAKPSKVQRTLSEAWRGTAASDVLRRSRHDDLCRYQAERRCGCAPRKGSRDGCFFAIDGRFETQLAAFSPAGARFYISHGLDTLLGHLREVLQIPPNAKLMRRPDRVVVYGWSSLLGNIQ
jgi:hypothetical protein